MGPITMSDRDYEFEIWQGGIAVAMGSGPDLDAVRREMLHYATQYIQDGPITIKGSPELAPKPAPIG